MSGGLDRVQLRAELLARVEELRLACKGAEPLDPEALVHPLTTELDATRHETDPIPRGPFPSHRQRGLSFIRLAKKGAALILKPLNRFLFERQASFNRRIYGTQRLVESQLHDLARKVAWLDDRVRYWDADLRRAREERLAVLTTLDQLARQVEAHVSGSQVEPGREG